MTQVTSYQFLSTSWSFIFHQKEFIPCYRKCSLGQGNIFIGVCQEFCSQGGVCLSACWETHPLEETPPRADTPQEQTFPRADTLPEQTPSLGADPPEQTPPGSRHPPAQTMLGDTVNVRAVHILLECNLVVLYFQNESEGV